MRWSVSASPMAWTICRRCEQSPPRRRQGRALGPPRPTGSASETRRPSPADFVFRPRLSTATKARRGKRARSCRPQRRLRQAHLRRDSGDNLPAALVKERSNLLPSQAQAGRQGGGRAVLPGPRERATAAVRRAPLADSAHGAAGARPGRAGRDQPVGVRQDSKVCTLAHRRVSVPSGAPSDQPARGRRRRRRSQPRRSSRRAVSVVFRAARRTITSAHLRSVAAGAGAPLGRHRSSSPQRRSSTATTAVQPPVRHDLRFHLSLEQPSRSCTPSTSASRRPCPVRPVTFGTDSRPRAPAGSSARITARKRRRSSAHWTPLTLRGPTRHGVGPDGHMGHRKPRPTRARARDDPAPPGACEPRTDPPMHRRRGGTGARQIWGRPARPRPGSPRHQQAAPSTLDVLAHRRGRPVGAGPRRYGRYGCRCRRHRCRRR